MLCPVNLFLVSVFFSCFVYVRIVTAKFVVIRNCMKFCMCSYKCHCFLFSIVFALLAAWLLGKYSLVAIGICMVNRQCLFLYTTIELSNN